ncbi:MAG: uracil-DNA glycosylase [Planctomycetota bacterium]|nr:uracil-DNA glycosylase [Planctomycetota bacterium]
MAKEVDTDKVVRQHLDMEGFFTGYVIRGAKSHESVEPLRREPLGGPPVKASTSGAMGELEAVAAEVRQCCKCGLGSTRTHPVPGEGSSTARIMFVGEAPGADEDAQGRPFVGRAGQLLDKIIGACGLKREDVFIGNILKCRPPGNRDPREEEIFSCLPYLQRQIEAIGPEVIIALGAHAARTLLETDKPIGQLRGHFHEYSTGIGRPPIKLMATYHPAYILRNYTPETRGRVWEDMKKVLGELGLPVPDRGKG